MAKRVFVVDDEKNVADRLTFILRRSGHEASVFYDAESALHQLEFRCPHLVVSDVVMPGMNGVELAILIKQRYPECKVLLCSGQALNVNILAMVDNRRYRFECLAKPIHPVDLLVTVETLNRDF